MQVKLVAMKRSFKEPQTGDIFVLQPLERVYYYGKVIESKVDSKYLGFKSWYLIFIYNLKTAETIKDIDLNDIPLLIAPMVVNKRPWTMGYFVTISSSSISKYDIAIDYGFWSESRNKYFDLRGNEMSYKPYYSGVFGLGSYGAVAHEIGKVLNK
jgi:hypothetical protein